MVGNVDHESDSDDLDRRYARELESLRAKHELEARQAKELADLKAKFEDEKFAKKRMRQVSGPSAAEGPVKRARQESGAAPVLRVAGNMMSNAIVLDDSEDDDYPDPKKSRHSNGITGQQDASPRPQPSERRGSSRPWVIVETAQPPTRLDPQGSLNSASTPLPFPSPGQVKSHFRKNRGLQDSTPTTLKSDTQEWRSEEPMILVNSHPHYPELDDPPVGPVTPRTKPSIAMRIFQKPKLRQIETRPRKVLDLVISHTVRTQQWQAALAYTRGEVRAENPCECCRKGHGPFPKCVVMPGEFKGACCNCHYNVRPMLCDFRVCRDSVKATNPLGLPRNAERDDESAGEISVKIEDHDGHDSDYQPETGIPPADLEVKNGRISSSY